MKNTVMVIGKTANGHGYEVRYNKEQELISCPATMAVIYNVKTIEQAYEVAERNFHAFKRMGA